MDLLYRLFGPEHIALQNAVAVVCVLALSLLLTPAMRALAIRLRIMAPVRERDIHTIPTPRLGGIAIYLAFATGILLFEPLTGTRHDSLSGQPITPQFLEQLRGLLLGATVAVIVGVIDDIRMPNGLPAGLHFLGQVLAAGAALRGGLHPVPGISNPLANHLFYAHPDKHQQILLLGPIGVIFTIFWIVGMMNTVNFLDGLDGLATGVVAIAAILLAIWSGRTHDEGFGPLLGSQVLVLPPLILAAALLGFLRFNWAPARIFMGDSGAQAAGFIIGALAILGPAKIGTALLILAIPILDIAWVFVRRGRRFARADAGHLHHQLLRLGWSARRIVLSFYGICIALGTADLLLQRISRLIAFLLVAAITVLILARMTARRPHPTTANDADLRDQTAADRLEQEARAVQFLREQVLAMPEAGMQRYTSDEGLNVELSAEISADLELVIVRLRIFRHDEIALPMWELSALLKAVYMSHTWVGHADSDGHHRRFEGFLPLPTANE